MVHLQSIAILGTVISGLLVLAVVGVAAIFEAPKTAIVAVCTVLALPFIGFVILGIATAGNSKFYKPETIAVKAGMTIHQVCSVERPTWHLSACIKQVHSQNTHIDLAHLRPGDKLFLDEWNDFQYGLH